MNLLLSSSTEQPTNWVTSIGPLLTGISELLLAVGAGVGFLIRTRKNARRERLRTEAAASLAATEAKRALEEKLEAQYKVQIEALEAQVRTLQERNDHLLERLLGTTNDQ
jgi:hypothetical protein